jgi:lipopolysaccharide/colanic/teichoic acid biosynthesis glycosyltransferase
MTVTKDKTVNRAQIIAGQSPTWSWALPVLEGELYTPRAVDHIQDYSSASPYALVKTGVEWAAAFVMLALAAPLIVGLAMLVKATSAGPAFYSQIRLGRFGRPFRIYKLRTMAHRCEETTGPVLSVADDHRVTWLGRWLRDTHLDEIPQLWNVLCGHMSLIGPRPERPEIAEKIEQALPGFRARLLVRPGITGLAQLRLPISVGLNFIQRKLAYDIYYIHKMSVTIDARIACSTLLLFIGQTARARQLLLPFVLTHAEDSPDVTTVPVELSATNPRVAGCDERALPRAA